MFNFLKISYTIFFLIFSFFLTPSFSEIIKKIEITGNDRISNNTVIMFSTVNVDDDINQQDLNNILLKLYDTNYFENINLSLEDGKLIINVKEYPIIQDVIFEGIKSNKIVNVLKDDLTIKERSSYNKLLINDEKNRLFSALKNLGYYSPKIEILSESLNNNLINIIINVDLGDKAKIKKISFIGNKVFKDSKLSRIIASEEYKFWKFISGKKFLNENLVNFDKRLLRNFYLNNGYYNVVINSSFAKIINDNEFELIYNIESNKKVYFNEIELVIPDDFEKTNFNKIENLFGKIKGKHYSINLIDKILEQIDDITLLDQYKFIKAKVTENLIDDKINLIFN